MLILDFVFEKERPIPRAILGWDYKIIIMLVRNMTKI
jgi:hypothetical protein